MAEMTDQWSIEDADRAIATVCIIMKHVGTLPQELVDAYDEAIESADSRVNRYFYERLVADCPDSIDYFAECSKKEEPKVEPKAAERISRKLHQIPIDEIPTDD